MSFPFRATIILITLCFLVPSCVSEEEVPSEYLSKEQMISVMTEIHLAEGYSQAQQLKGLPRPDFRDSIYAFVLKKHGVRARNLDSSMKLYLRREKDMTEIYDRVIENLNHLEKTNRGQE